MKRIRPLESLRFIAILGIFFHHLSFLSRDSFTKPLYKLLYDRYFYYGYTALGFFLVLSGFVIALQYGEKVVGGSFSYSTFLIKRIVRLYPIHLVTLLLSVPMVLRDVVPMFWEKLILNTTMLHGFVPQYEVIYSFNSVSWSLSILLFGYLLAPSFMLLIMKLALANYRIPYIFLGCIIGISFLFAFNQPLDSFYLHISLYISPAFRIIEFLAGVVVGVIVLHNRGRRHLSIRKSTIIELISMMFVILAFVTLPYISPQLRWGTYMLPFFCVLIFVFATTQGFFAKILSSRFIVFLGSISFEFFMIHVVVIRFILDFLRRATPITVEQTVIYSFVLSLLGALILRYIVTLPLQKKVRLKLGKG